MRLFFCLICLFFNFIYICFFTVFHYSPLHRPQRRERNEHLSATVELSQAPRNPYRPQYVFCCTLEKYLQACRSEENVMEIIVCLLCSDLLCREIAELEWVWDCKLLVHNVPLNSSGAIAKRWMRYNFSLFMPVLAFMTSIYFGMTTHQKPFLWCCSELPES